MTLVINKTLTEKEIKISLKKMIKKPKSIGLRKHFGLSSDKTDAVAFQKKLRDE